MNIFVYLFVYFCLFILIIFCRKGQVAVSGNSDSIVEAFFNDKKTDLLSSLSKAFSVEPIKAKGEGLTPFSENDFKEEKVIPLFININYFKILIIFITFFIFKIYFLARWTPERKDYFPSSFNNVVKCVLMCHHYLKDISSPTGIQFIGKCPKVVVLLILGEMGRYLMRNPPYPKIKKFQTQNKKENNENCTIF